MLELVLVKKSKMDGEMNPQSSSGSNLKVLHFVQILCNYCEW